MLFFDAVVWFQTPDLVKLFFHWISTSVDVGRGCRCLFESSSVCSEPQSPVGLIKPPRLVPLQLREADVSSADVSKSVWWWTEIQEQDEDGGFILGHLKPKTMFRVTAATVAKSKQLCYKKKKKSWFDLSEAPETSSAWTRPQTPLTV